MFYAGQLDYIAKLNGLVGGTTAFAALLVGVGVSWAGTMEATTGSGAIQVGDRNTIQAIVNGDYLAINANVRFDGAAYKYIETAAAYSYQVSPILGNVWYRAPSGTAGTIATLTELMRLNETGLGIGVAPASKIHLYGTAGTGSPAIGAGALYLQDSAGVSGNGGGIVFGAAQGYFAGIKGNLTDGGSNTTGTLSFYTRRLAADASLTFALHIAALGYVGINVAPSFMLDVKGGAGNGVPAQRWEVDGGSAIYVELERDSAGGGTATFGTQSNHNLYFKMNDQVQVHMTGTYLYALGSEGMRAAKFVDSTNVTGAVLSTTQYSMYVNSANVANMSTSILAVGVNAPTTGQISVNGLASGTGAGSFFHSMAGGATIMAMGNYSAIHGGAYNGNGLVYTVGDLLFTLNASSTVKVLFGANYLWNAATAAGTTAAGVFVLANGTAPTTSPVGVGQFWVEAGALKYRGSAGTVTTIAVA